MARARRWSRIAVVGLCLGLGAGTGQAAIRRVPQSYSTIQAAVNASATGDVVLVSRGTYAGGVVIAGKAITLASEYINTGNPSDVSQTVIAGGSPLVRIEATAKNTTVQGITFQGGGYGLANYATFMHILDNRFLDTQDGVSFERGGGVCRGNYFYGSKDDGIDVDYPNFDIIIENNTMLNSGDDGIEIRAYPYTGPMANIVIRNNSISGSVEDGIQLIDYAGLSNHKFRIERNVIVASGKVGLGSMAAGNTVENFAGSPMTEEVQVVNNTFAGNPYAITGGDNMLVMNNIIVNSTQIGLKRIGASSWTGYNDFWNNGADYASSLVQPEGTLFANPFLDASYHLQPGSPCIDAGTASVVWNGATVNAPSFNIPAPDLGANESPMASPGRGDELLAHKTPDGASLELSWTPTCDAAVDYGVYEGTLGVWYSHAPVQCSTAGGTSVTITPGQGNRYLLVVPNNQSAEGSYGTDSNGLERPAAATGCRSTQHTGQCP